MNRLDTLLTDFFRSERPSPWPAAPESSPGRSPTQRRRPAAALAIALMILAVLTIAVAEKMPAPPRGLPTLDAGAATRPD